MSSGILTGYNVHTEEDRNQMLASMGKSTISDLFTEVPDHLRLKTPLNLPPAMSEWELERHLRALASKNATTLDHLSFLGGGAYEHYVPATVDAIASRGEFLTAYTPYQPEMAQGILRFLYDFQSVVGKLLGLPAVNCSVYDCATALAESAWMTCRITGNHRLAIAEGLWPEYRKVLEVYLKGRAVELITIPSDPKTGQIDEGALESILSEQKPGAVIHQTPNRSGVVERMSRIGELCKANDSLHVVASYPMLFGLMKNPGDCGVDIAVSEGQSLGLQLNAGGPYLGIIATREEYEMHLPGRIVGQCSDLKGEEALALVKEEREQHVARHEATSHICSNQANLALRALIYLCTVGEHGFQRIAELCTRKAHYLQSKLCELDGVKPVVSGPFFNEFLIELPRPASEVLNALREKQIFGGIPYNQLLEDAPENQLLIAVTETKSKADLDQAIKAFASSL
ncbi:aminomethyl-transferring glycine dehydrogenase subunit GcvPA [Rubellicoccus peritrichatus]|uniref:Aminomethyl-transferring glycine dehydrogenase subunit GcvPA n=1 Tax=Rubellicoccus peritrichatus TaxID=3080537 RepID=A0AAQ3QTF7_9BACT|nr:aminomethyl-transferring glycine dehydrogenase subunit GcvPA [Puniceicoccus sp. CR14]WOO43658.1 aminomethyl-transferring glycine dehydrogenase subunit GcvPA [Puniceicoccus sp. CR14]